MVCPVEWKIFRHAGGLVACERGKPGMAIAVPRTDRPRAAQLPSGSRRDASGLWPSRARASGGITLFGSGAPAPLADWSAPSNERRNFLQRSGRGGDRICRDGMPHPCDRAAKTEPTPLIGVPSSSPGRENTGVLAASSRIPETSPGMTSSGSGNRLRHGRARPAAAQPGGRGLVPSRSTLVTKPPAPRRAG
jgi:hypothetical protein